jgi:2-succinyl-6-hydroxy-2,4-cyclohexadiene-1-carboxylate synthase
MPVRWAETYVAARASAWRVLANRGANGIDGIVSTASGVARGGGRPTLLVTGDLAFLHDLGGLRSAREVKTGFVIVVLNNDGGGIFSHLPIARHEADFEPLFGTPHGCDLAMATRAMGLEHCLAGSIAEVASLVAGAFASGLVRVIEWRTERARTVREHADLARRAGVDDSRIEAAGIGWRVSRRGPRTELPVVFLHGFTGSGEFWMPVANALPRRYCIVPDLPGHGGTDAPVPAQSWRIDRASDALVALLDRLGIARFVLAGYSMGGRLALGLALRHADRVAALALVGASPGIASAEERSQRAGDDLALADSIERDGMEAFCRKWEANPLFATQERLAPELREAMRAQRRRQDPSRLAQALRAFGTGFQPPVHGELARLALPVLVVAGGEDAKYSAIAREMAGRIPGATLRIVPGAGHAVPLESAGRFAEELEGFLTRSIDA